MATKFPCRWSFQKAPHLYGPTAYQVTLQSTPHPHPSWFCPPDMVTELHDDVSKWKHFPCCWAINRSEVDPLIKASDAELWCFVWSAHGQTVEQTIEMPVIWELRCHDAHYDVNVMFKGLWAFDFQRNNLTSNNLRFKTDIFSLFFFFVVTIESSPSVFSCDQAALWMV